MKTRFILFVALFLLTPLISRAAVVINEIAWMGTNISTSNEWIEFYNNGSSPIDIGSWSIYGADTDKCLNFSDADGHINTVIPTDGYLIYANHKDDVKDSSGISLVDIWDATIGLNDTSPGQLILYDALNCPGNPVDLIDQSTKWLAGKTTKQTMERINAGWQTSLNPGGTPKTQNSSGATEEPESATEEPESATEEPESATEEPESATEEPATLTIPTENQPPIADAGNNIIAFIDEEITFDGSKSYDPDGLDLAYEWNLGEGGVENDVIATHKYSFPGTYLVTLMVFDGRYYTKDTITVEIYPKKITINEFLPSPTGKDAEQEWIELYNDSDQIVDISGWQLDDEEGGSNPFTFPENTLIAPKSYIVFPRLVTKVALNNNKGKVRLLLSTEIVFQEISYEKAPEGKSSARTPEGFVWSIPTPGLPNIIGVNNKELSYNQPLQTKTTDYPSENLALNYKNDENQIKGGWAYLPQQNSPEKSPKNTGNLIANLGQITEKSNSKLILIILTIIIAALAIGIGVMKLKKK